MKWSNNNFGASIQIVANKLGWKAAQPSRYNIGCKFAFAESVLVFHTSCVLATGDANSKGVKKWNLHGKLKQVVKSS
jgi:hypothetical protein